MFHTPFFKTNPFYNRLQHWLQPHTLSYFDRLNGGFQIVMEIPSYPFFSGIFHENQRATGEIIEVQGYPVGPEIHQFPGRWRLQYRSPGRAQDLADCWWIVGGRNARIEGLAHRFVGKV